MESALKTAEKYGIPLTFFPAGRANRENPAVYKEISVRSHAIENHTYSHKLITSDTTKRKIAFDISL